MFLHCKNILKFTFKYLRLKKFKYCETYSVNKRIQIKRSCGGLQLMKLSPSSDESWQAVLRVAQSRNGVTFVPCAVVKKNDNMKRSFQADTSGA